MSDKSYPSDHKPDGYASRAIAQAMQESIVICAELVAIIDECLQESGGDDRNARRAIRELSLRLLHEYDTQAKVAEGNFRDAKKAAQKLGSETAAKK